MLILCLMGHCNNDCKFCLVKKEMSSAEDIPFDKIKAAINKLPKGMGVDFFGGEPTLYPFFLEALEYSNKLGHRCTIATNGRTFARIDFARHVASIGVSQIRTSIYGDTHLSHDFHTQVDGSFDETIIGIKNIIGLGIELYVNVVITSKNFTQLLGIVELMHSLSVHHLKFGSLVDSGRCLDLIPNPDDVRINLRKAIQLCQMYGIDVAIEKSPLCMVPEYYEKCVFEPDDELFAKADKCEICSLADMCIGITKEQLDLFGEDAVIPFINRLTEPGIFNTNTTIAEEHIFLRWDDDLPHAITVLLKVAGTCNLTCDYCYASRNFRSRKVWLDKELVDKLLGQTLASNYGHIDFNIHGGEPLTWGKDRLEYFTFRQKELEFGTRKEYVNRIQINGSLLTNELAKLLKESNIEIGVSLDGPKTVHDAHRRNRAGKGSFNSVMRGINILLENGINFDLLSVVTSETIQNKRLTFRFFSKLFSSNNGKIKTITFLPSFEIDPISKALLPSSITPDQYSEFLLYFFDHWFDNDDENFHITFFEEIITVLLGGIASMCTFRRGCNGFLTIEPDGSLYPCDRFSGLSEFWLGNLYDQPLSQILEGDPYKAYINKVDTYPPDCLQCEWLKLCRGGCMYHAWAVHQSWDQPSYYCSSLKTIYRHIEETLIDNLAKYERYSKQN